MRFRHGKQPYKLKHSSGVKVSLNVGMRGFDPVCNLMLLVSGLLIKQIKIPILIEKGVLHAK